jgi:hypothetical protein
MERITITTSGGQTIPAIRFNGRTYRKHNGGKYYTTGTRKLHRDVWEYYNGPIPKGYQVHHKDFDIDNNDIENLVCLTIKEHQQIHTEQHRQNGVAERARQRFHDIRPRASEWHRSEEGREWHRQHARGQEFADVECTCVVCGKPFTAKKKDSKYCSKRCSAKARRDSGIDNETRICEVCGKPFDTNKYGKQRICSLSCSAKYRRSRRKGSSGI